MNFPRNRKKNAKKLMEKQRKVEERCTSEGDKEKKNGEARDEEFGIGKEEKFHTVQRVIKNNDSGLSGHCSNGARQGLRKGLGAKFRTDKEGKVSKGNNPCGSILRTTVRFVVKT